MLPTGIPATSTLPGSHGPGSGHGQVTPGGPSGEPVAILPPAPEPQPYPGAPEQTRPAGSPSQYPIAPEPTRPVGSPHETGPGAPYPSPPSTTVQHTGAPIPTTTTGGPPPTYTSGASDMVGHSVHGAIIGFFVCSVLALVG